MSEDHGAWWGEIPVAMEPPPVYRRSRGLDANESTVTIPRAYFRSLTPEVPATDDEVFKIAEPKLPLLMPFMHLDRPITFAPLERPPFAADLVFAQGEKDKPRVFHARHLYLVEARIPDPENGDTSLVEFQLAPITRFWPDYGWITRTWNLGLSSDPGLVYVGPTGLELARAADRQWAAHTAKESGRAATPLREIAQELLNELPGRLEIVEWPDVFLADKAPPEVRAWGARPLEVLRGVLDAFSLYPDVGADLTVRVYPIGQGPAGELEDDAHGGQLVRAHDPATGEGAWKGQIVAGGDRWAQRPAHRPREAIVLGDRTVSDAEVDCLTPVLYYEEPERDDRASRRVVLEATPHNLELLAQGQVTGGDFLDEIEEVETPITDEDRRKINLILGARDKSIAVATPGAPTSDDAPAGPTGRRDAMFWQRIVLERDDEVWTRFLPHLAEPVKALLGQQLFRRYMLPRGLRRLLPLLARATRDYKKGRLPIKVEAFSFRPASVRRRKPERAQLAPDAQPDPDSHEGQLAELVKLQTEIANFEARKERLRAPTGVEFAAAIQTLYERNGLVLDPTAKFKAGTGASQESRTKDKFFEAWAQVGRTWIRAAANSGLLRVLGADSVKGALNTYASDGLTSDDVNARIAQIDLELARLRGEEAKLLAKMNPRGALERELGAVEAELRSQAVAGVVITSQMRERAKALRAQIVALESEEQERTQRPPADDESPYEVVNYHLNMARHEVDFRVVDEALGIIEVLGDLPGWLGDPMVADPRTTFFLPMPVRISFGTYNGIDVDLRTDPEFHRLNFYCVQAASMLAASPELLPFAGPIGNRLPPPTGEDQVRFTFARDSVKDGNDGGGRAAVGRHPWPILVDDPDDPFRLLVRLPPAGKELEDLEALKAKIARLLDPASFTADELRNRSAQAMTLLPLAQGAAIRDNRAELLARALPWARAALSAPDLLDTGSLTVYGPRTVPCTGRVSAVEVTLAGPGEGFVTTVSFQGDAEPLPGMEGPVRSAEPVRLAFGIDTERTQNS